jgi:hypothetical protein
MDKELIVYGASDDLVDFEGAFNMEYDLSYGHWFGKITDTNDEYVLLHLSYGSDGVEWKIRAENPFKWDIIIGNRPDRDSDPALFIYTPTGNIDIEELDEIWENPNFNVVAI